MRSVVVAAIVLLAPARAYAQSATIDGVIEDADTFEPIAGAVVQAGAARAQSLDDGGFTLALAAGAVTLSIAVPGRPAGQVAITVAPGETSAVYLVDAHGAIEAGEAIVIAEEFHEPPPPPPPAAVTTSIDASEAAHVAGSGGDAGKVVSNLAGVTRAGAGSSALVVWGAAPEDTAILVDGVELPALYHQGGVRSVLATDLVGKIELQPGAFGADAGRVLGGVVRVTTAPLPDHATARLTLDALDGAATIAGPLSKTVRAGGGLRWSWLDRVIAPLLDERSAELFAIPRYRDGHLRVRTVLGEGEHVDVVALGADDHLTQTLGASDPATERSRALSDGFARLWVRWQRAAGGVEAAVTPWLGVDDHHVAEHAGAAGTDAHTRTWRTGLRAEYRARAGTHARLGLGADLALAASSLSRVGTLTDPAREGDPTVFARPPGVDVAADDWGVTETELAPNATVELDLGPVTVAPGLRIGADVVDVSRVTPKIGATPAIGTSRFDWLVEPRIAATWRVRKDLKLSAAFGRHHRAPAPEDLSAVFGNPTLGPEAASCGTIAAAYDLGAVAIEAAGFARLLDHLAVRAESATPMLAALLTDDGTGHVEGAQLTVRRGGKHALTGWLAYTFARSHRTDHADQPERRFDFDQPHVLTAVADYARGGWTAGVRLRVSSGLPRTPVVGVYYDALLDRWQPKLGKVDSVRLPPFVELDLRGERAFRAGPAAMSVYLEVENATAHDNVEDWAYSYDYASKEEVRGLPILAIAGVEARL